MGINNKKYSRARVRTKKPAVCLLLIVIITLSASILSGFTPNEVKIKDSDTQQIDTLLKSRCRVMQRYMFGAHSEGAFFTQLSQTETYPVLSDDYKSACAAKNSSADKVINIKTVETQCIDRTRRYGIYLVTVKWYMSGSGGYYTETVTYRLRTDILNGVHYLAEITPVAE